MQLTTITTILCAMTTILLAFGMYIITKTKCPVCPELKPCVIDNIGIPSVRIIPELDIQFSENNLPSVVYTDIFTGPNVWLGGYNSAMNAGRAVVKHQNT